MTGEHGYYCYWGKARKEGDEGAPYHLLPYHCLDVAAVAQVLLSQQHGLKHRLCALSGLEEKDFLKWIVFFLAIHDLGKFSESFQNLRPDLLETLQGKTSDNNYSHRHDSLGYALWRVEVRNWLLNVQSNGRGRKGSSLSGVDYWALATMGHHGLPPKNVENDFDHFNNRNRQDALAFVKDIESLFLENKDGLANPNIKDAKKFSWWLAGFSVLCDWLGSNSDIFQYHREPMALETYWDKAVANAEEAIAQAELLPTPTVSLKTLQDLFSPKLKTATPLQNLCGDIPLVTGPQLFILEDVTGAGKTEASIMLLHRLLANREAEGVYFALPTMATANAMYDRMSDVYQRLYEDGGKPSLVLSHGARDLSSKFRQSIINIDSKSQDSYGDETVPATAHCSLWLADNRKKALLAEVGVGTIDQSLLAILPSKHQSLRMLGLLGKVLVVDEVHACDAYMNELLCTVIKAHASAGGSTILLSATLPAQTRQKLTNAFTDGAATERRVIKKKDRESYPLLSYCNSNDLEEIVVPTRESVRREVSVKLLSDSNEILDEIEIALTNGQCVCWIRNTVDDARETYSLIQERFPMFKVDLFHARFAMADRLNIEGRILRNFGFDSTSELRQGKILIATQVVEQSLDLDFDLMITDLAPIDLIIQRAGRLCRHTRNSKGDIVSGQDQRGMPTLLLYSPNPGIEIKEDWFKSFFTRASGVYPNHGQLWLTAKLITEKGCFRMPEDARDLIEGVYASDDYPEILQKSVLNTEGENSANRGLAALNALDLSAGYGGGSVNCWWEEAITPTRLGEETITVYLACWDGLQLTPWINEGSHPWQNSAVQMRKALLTSEKNDSVPEGELEKTKLQLPSKGKWAILLALEERESGEWVGNVIDGKNAERVVRYDLKMGMSVA